MFVSHCKELVIMPNDSFLVVSFGRARPKSGNGFPDGGAWRWLFYRKLCVHRVLLVVSAVTCGWQSNEGQCNREKHRQRGEEGSQIRNSLAHQHLGTTERVIEKRNPRHCVQN